MKKLLILFTLILSFTLLPNATFVLQAANELHEYWILTTQLTKKIINGDVVVKALSTSIPAIYLNSTTGTITSYSTQFSTAAPNFIIGITTPIPSQLGTTFMDSNYVVWMATNTTDCIKSYRQISK